VGASLVLHPGVAWELVFHRGASRVDLDLRQGRLTGLEIAGGVSQVRLALPAPDAICASASEARAVPGSGQGPGKRCAISVRVCAVSLTTRWEMSGTVRK
jgi:hypothetical protein